MKRENIQVFGSFENLKEAIAKEYQNKLASVTYQSDQRMLALENNYQQQVHDLHTRKSKRIAEEAQRRYENVFMQGHSRLREDYESFREELLRNAMQKLWEELKKKSTSKSYIAYAKKLVKGKKVTQVEGHSTTYKKAFRKFKRVSGLIGLKITCQKQVYDLTINRLFMLERDSIRERIYSELMSSQENKTK